MTKMATITISRKLNDLVNNGWEQQELDAFDSRTVVRDFLKENTVYGGKDDKIGGEWVAAKVGIVIKDGTEEKKRLIWAVCYAIKKDDKLVVQDALTKSFLLSNGRFDASGKHIKAVGDVREWADRNIINGILEKEWCEALASELNARGLMMVKETYQQPRKDGSGSFPANINHPYFADTFGK